MNYVFKVECCFVIDYGDLNVCDNIGYAGNKLIKVIICNLSCQMSVSTQLIKTLVITQILVQIWKVWNHK